MGNERVTNEPALDLECSKEILRKRLDEFEKPPEKTLFGDNEDKYVLTQMEQVALDRVQRESKYPYEPWNRELGELGALESRMEHAREIILKLQRAGEVLKADEIFGKVIVELTSGGKEMMVGGGYLFQAAKRETNPEFDGQPSDVDVLTKCSQEELAEAADRLWVGLGQGWSLIVDGSHLDIYDERHQQRVSVNCVGHMADHVPEMLAEMGMKTKEDDLLGMVLRHREPFEWLGQMGIVIKPGGEVVIARAGACIENEYRLAANPNTLTMFSPRILERVVKGTAPKNKNWGKVVRKGIEMMASLPRRMGKYGRTLLEKNDRPHPARLVLGEMLRGELPFDGEFGHTLIKDFQNALEVARMEDIMEMMLEVPVWAAMGNRELFKAMGYEIQQTGDGLWTVDWLEGVKNNENTVNRMLLGYSLFVNDERVLTKVKGVYGKRKTGEMRRCKDITEFFSVMASLAPIQPVDYEKMGEELQLSLGVDGKEFATKAAKLHAVLASVEMGENGRISDEDFREVVEKLEKCL